MPPRIRITKEQVDDAALSLVREYGFERLNARSLAEKLGSSVHPIFRTYTSMEDLKTAVFQMAECIYNDRMMLAMKQDKDGFLSMGMTYINFARTETNLFRLLFMSNAFEKQSIMDIVGNTKGDDEVISMLCLMTGLLEKSVKELYAGIWVTTHGIACMFAANSCQFNEEEIRRLLNNSFQGLLMKLKMEENQE